MRIFYSETKFFGIKKCSHEKNLKVDLNLGFCIVRVRLVDMNSSRSGLIFSILILK